MFTGTELCLQLNIISLYKKVGRGQFLGNKIQNKVSKNPDLLSIIPILCINRKRQTVNTNNQIYELLDYQNQFTSPHQQYTDKLYTKQL